MMKYYYEVVKNTAEEFVNYDDCKMLNEKKGAIFIFVKSTSKT